MIGVMQAELLAVVVVLSLLGGCTLVSGIMAMTKGKSGYKAVDNERIGWGW